MFYITVYPYVYMPYSSSETDIHDREYEEGQRNEFKKKK